MNAEISTSFFSCAAEEAHHRVEMELLSFVSFLTWESWNPDFQMQCAGSSKWTEEEEIFTGWKKGKWESEGRVSYFLGFNSYSLPLAKCGNKAQALSLSPLSFLRVSASSCWHYMAKWKLFNIRATYNQNTLWKQWRKILRFITDTYYKVRGLLCFPLLSFPISIK